MSKINKENKINVKERLVDNTLDLSLLDISEVPVKKILPLRRATILDLSNNKIEILRSDFAALTHIVKLDLSRNQIKILPKEFGSLAQLRHLDLYNNKLEHLPISFGQLSKLKYLDLKGNPLNKALAQVVGQCSNQKECTDAAKKAVKLMGELELEIKTEQLAQKEAHDKKRMEEEELEKEKLEQEKAKEKPKQKKKKVAKAVTAPGPNNTEASESATETHKKKNNKKAKLKVEKGKPRLYNPLGFIILIFSMLTFQFIVLFFYPQFFEKIIDAIPESYKNLTEKYYMAGKKILIDAFKKE